MIPLPTDSLPKLAAFAGVALISASSTLWLSSSDASLKEVAVSNSTAAALAELTEQLNRHKQETSELLAAIRTYTERGGKLTKQGRFEEADTVLKLAQRTSEILHQQTARREELEAQVNQKAVEARSRQAASKTFQEAETSRLQIALLGAATGTLLAVVGGIAWYRGGRKRQESKLPIILSE